MYIQGQDWPLTSSSAGHQPPSSCLVVGHWICVISRFFQALEFRLKDCGLSQGSVTITVMIKQDYDTSDVVPRTLSKFGERASRTQDLLPGTAFQITFVASLHLQPPEDIWKRFYSLKFLTLPRTFNIVLSAGHLCKWTQNRRWWWWWWWLCSLVVLYGINVVCVGTSVFFSLILCGAPTMSLTW